MPQEIKLSLEQRIDTAIEVLSDSIRASHKLNEAGIYVPGLQKCYEGISTLLPEIVQLLDPNEEHKFTERMVEATKDLPSRKELLDEVMQGLQEQASHLPEHGTGQYL